MPSTTRQSLFDEAALAFIRTRQPNMAPQLAGRTAAEIARASALFDKNGWSDSPATYHRRPPAPLDDDVATPRTYSWPRRHELVKFSSGFYPRDVEPGADRWVSKARNNTVFVRLLRHDATARPWVVCLHGFGMSASRFDLAPLWASHLHTNAGFNVAVPALPLHGPRRSRGDGQLLSLDLTMTLHAVSQAIWDVRRLIQWIYRSGATAVGVYGLSLGGYLAALLAGIEPVDCIVAGIPFSDVLGLMAYHHPPPEYVDILRSAAANNAFRVVSPLALTPLVGPDRRAIFAGRADRLIPNSHSVALGQAWPQSPIHWYSGGHIGYLWSRDTKAFTTRFLRDALCSPGRL
ncbi:MAG TPA: alpha/beta fold hydrolase [Mycobacterium sp.]|nr:alpha/beta fold hydrolase [Mycobacterium sp.]